MSEGPVSPTLLRALVLWPTVMGAIVGSEAGGDMHMPWWLLLLVIGGAFATGHRAMNACIRDTNAWGWLVLMTLGGFALIQGGVWAGENGAETLHQPWRWLLATFVCAVWCEGWAREPAAAPGWVHWLASKQKQ